MRKLLQLGFVLGFAGTLAAAYFFPWVSYTRFPSAATVVANGGRGEQFILRLPVDRIQSSASVAGELRTALHGAALGLPVELASATSRIEHFKVRDSSGNVVGVASRHWAEIGTVPQTAWMLTLPSRGTVVMTGPGEPADYLAQALRAEGWEPGGDFVGELALAVGGEGHSVAATGEFSGIDFRLTETWSITGIDAEGELRGTIELNTIGERGS